MFDGDVADRAEEWRVTVEPSGKARQVLHRLPEARPGARLARDAAQALAERHVRENFGVDPARCSSFGGPAQRPARPDWAFVLSDPRVDVGKDGEARMAVTLAGDEVVGAGRYVYVPESWLRAERERSGRVQIAKMAVGLVFVLAALAALVAAVRSWMRGHCDTRALALVFAVVLLGSAAGVAVTWPSLAMQWTTTEPIAWQALLAVARSLLASTSGRCRRAGGGRGLLGRAHGAQRSARGSAAAVGGRRGRRTFRRGRAPWREASSRPTLPSGPRRRSSRRRGRGRLPRSRAFPLSRRSASVCSCCICSIASPLRGRGDRGSRAPSSSP